jgi:mycothiol system anti-sigma-R factor
MNEHDRIRCEEVVAHLLTYLDGEIDAEKQAQIDRHLAECRACFSRAEFERTLREKVQQLGVANAPESLQRRIDSIINEF